ncbi:MAG: pitrilysin family protein [Candidatus Omnitrophica bacterium]|nr:pitrilysin family protein [Candidatus Omnitrophota bacterium]MDD5513237.1 pitrilysin family protein [Candidatus Omnitrophota bacterium]
MFRKSRLENGLRIITRRMPDMQSVSLGIWIKVGGRYENDHEKGISHFIEHLLFKGTKKYSCRAIKESIEGVGGSLNGFTSEELTCYLVKMPSNYLELALDILSDMVIDPVFPPLEVEKEKQVILEEIKMYRDQPQSYVHELLDALLWPDQPLGIPIIGSPESVSRISRKDLLSFKSRAYTPMNIVVSCAGVVDEDKLARSVAKRFRGLKAAEVNAFSQARQSQEEPRLRIFHKDTEQTHLAMGFHAFRRDHPLKYAVGLLHVILGGNMSSRLFNELREKRGLAYEIGTQVRRFHDTGSFQVHAGIDNRKVGQSLDLIRKELDKAAKIPVRPDEFKRAKEFYLGQLSLAMEETMDSMLWLGESMVTLNKTFTLEQIVREVRQVTRADLREVARQIFKPSRVNLALVGPETIKQDEIYRHLSL